MSRARKAIRSPPAHPGDNLTRMALRSVVVGRVHAWCRALGADVARVRMRFREAAGEAASDFVRVVTLEGDDHSHFRQMPRFASRKSLIVIRSAATFFLIQRLLGLLSIGLVICGAAVLRMDLIHSGLMAAGLWVCLRIAQFLMFTPCRCPLCLGALFARSRCLPHPKAVRLLGSYRLATSLGVLFKGRFKCAFCGTRMTMVATELKTATGGRESLPVRFRTLAGPGRPGIFRISSRSRRSRKATFR